jgi:BlaI family transcriptional regulator, penicillinase repressor
MARTASDQPTDGELELLQLLWDLGPSELGTLHQALNQRRKVALTTVATMLTVMLAKNLVKRKQGPRGWTYSARVSRGHAAKPIVRKLVDRVFEGSAQRLVAHLLETHALTDADRQELLKLLQQTRTESRRKGASQGVDE